MINKITFTSVKKVNDPISGEHSAYKVVINGVTSDVPIDPDKFNSKGIRTYSGNRHYAEIKRQVDAGELTIEDAD